MNEQEITREELAERMETIARSEREIAAGTFTPEQAADYRDALCTVMKARVQQGSFEQAMHLLRRIMKFADDSREFSTAAGWLIYSFLKCVAAEDFVRRQFASAIPECIDAYTRLNVETPSQLHSSMLYIANKLSGENTPWFFPFIRRYGFASLQPGDFQEHQRDGRKIPPLAEQIFVKTARVVEKTGNAEFSHWLLESIPLFREKIGPEMWLLFHEGRLLVQTGKHEEARIYLRDVLVKQKNHFWIWAAYGGTFQSENPDLYLACLCKALSFPVDELLLCPIREELARFLIARGNHAEARVEIELVFHAADAHDYKPSPELSAYREADWYQNAPRLPNNLALYLKHFSLADSLLHDHNKAYTGVVTAYYEDKKGVFIQFDKDKATLYKLPKGASTEELPRPGDVVKTYMDEVIINGQKRYTTVKIETAQEQPSDTFYKRYSGELKLPAKSDGAAFGFVGDVFVSTELSKRIGKGARVKGAAVYEFNRKRNQYGWKAVTIEVDKNPPPNPPPPPAPAAGDAGPQV